MDLSKFKWPVIIILVVGIIWLGSSGGINFMVNQFTKAEPGVDANRDRSDEAWLTSIGGYLQKTFQYEEAYEVMSIACDRYGQNSSNYLFNQLRMARCLEKLGDYQGSYEILCYLRDSRASEFDDRIPIFDVLNGRAAKLKEVHELY